MKQKKGSREKNIRPLSIENLNRDIKLGIQSSSKVMTPEVLFCICFICVGCEIFKCYFYVLKLMLN